MPHRKERQSGSSHHAQGSAGTVVRARRVGWVSGAAPSSLTVPCLAAPASGRWLLTGCIWLCIFRNKNALNLM